MMHGALTLLIVNSYPICGWLTRMEPVLNSSTADPSVGNSYAD